MYLSWDSQADQSAPGEFTETSRNLNISSCAQSLMTGYFYIFYILLHFKSASTAMHCHAMPNAQPAWFRWASANSAFSRSTPWLMRCLTMCLSRLKLKNGEERMTCGCHGKSNSEVFKMAGLLEFWWVVQAFSSSLIAAFRSCALSSSSPSVSNDQHLKAVLPMLSLHGFITNCPTSPFFTEASAKFLQ